jgi:hypothetical protein
MFPLFPISNVVVHSVTIQTSLDAPLNHGIVPGNAALDHHAFLTFVKIHVTGTFFWICILSIIYLKYVLTETSYTSQFPLWLCTWWRQQIILCSTFNILTHHLRRFAAEPWPKPDPFLSACVFSVDSCSNMCIEDSSISVSHDAISLKSGWDEQGIAFGRPTSDIHISRLDLQSSLGAALAFGSEMSGGISDIHADRLLIHSSSRGVFFKTAPGRGGYIRDTVISNVQMEDVDVAVAFTGDWPSHPDDQFDPTALPVVSHITLKNMTGTRISVAGVLSGIAGDPFTDICLSNINFSLADSASPTSHWSCSNVSGYSELVFPEPCLDLQTQSSDASVCSTLPSFHAAAIAAA